jgi:hypothetical protein
MNEIEEKYQGKVAISLTVDNEIHLCSTKDIREVILEEFRAIIQKQKETNAYRSKGENIIYKKCPLVYNQTYQPF